VLGQKAHPACQAGREIDKAETITDATSTRMATPKRKARHEAGLIANMREEQSAALQSKRRLSNSKGAAP
jgi:hypothetical protein